jgi:hypothetical protein
MKNFLIVTTIVLLSFSCSSDSSSSDLTGKVFYGVATASCAPTTIDNLTPDEYVLMSFVDENDNEVSYQPRPNTWYRMCNGSACMWAKTGSDVSPVDSPISFDFIKTEYTSPCQ